MPSKKWSQKHHYLQTCYDNRVDDIVTAEVSRIRQIGRLEDKDISRPPGGVHLLTVKASCREGFYKTLNMCRDIANVRVFHLWPHTNCRFCGIEAQEKIGSGTQSDLRFHLHSARKLLQGVTQYFAAIGGDIPEIDVRIILTIDQRIVTIKEAAALLRNIPAEKPHGSHCCDHENHHHNVDGQHFSV